jgi:DNA-directed RNA polymerase subunit omega
VVQKNITNEALKKKFKNQFELVSYAIALAENMILTGREPRVKTTSQNRAVQVLEEIAMGKDQLDPIPEHKNSENLQNAHIEEKPTGGTSKNSFEKKKTRKILAG